MSIAPDFCTLVWPFLHSQECSRREDCWLIGWNPRGLVVVVVTIVHGPSIEAAHAELERLRVCVSSPARGSVAHGAAAAPQLLGRLRGAKACGGSLDDAGRWVRSERRVRDIWIELLDGPVLDEVWCCGYHVQPCQLQVLRVDTRGRCAAAPTAFTATARFGCRGVRALVDGQLPLCVSGVRSALEGVLLPPHMAAAAGPRARRRDREFEPPPAAAAEDSAGAEGPPPAPGVPPRLDFATSADTGELAELLRASHAGRALCEAAKRRGDIDISNGDKDKDKDDGEGKGKGKETQVCWKRVVEQHLRVCIGVLIDALLIVLPLLTFLGKVSSCSALLEFRLREIIHWLGVLQGRTTVCGLHPVLPHQRHPDGAFHRYCALNFLSRVVVDGILGMLLSVLLTIGGNAAIVHSEIFLRYFMRELHLGYIDWFEGWPAGLKMNEDLDMTLCFFARLVLQFSFFDILSVLQWVSYVSNVVFFIAPFGASCAFAFVSDVCSVVSMRLFLLFHALSIPYRLMRSVMGSLFLQFRGMKYNPIRHRTDAYDFGVDQMLMGNLLFTVTVFLFPTVAVHYLYFAIVCMIIRYVQEILVATAYLTLYLPVFPFLYWLVKRHQWSGGIALTTPELKHVRSHTSARRTSTPGGKYPASITVEVTVVMRPLEFRAVMTDFLVVLSILVSQMNPIHMLTVIYQARKWTSMDPVKKLIPHLQKSPVEPCCTVGWPPGETGDEKA